MNTAEKLLAAATEIWQAYNEHPFVLGIQNGTLEKEKFRYYIIQDYLYLEDYAKTFAIGVAKAKNLKTANLFAKNFLINKMLYGLQRRNIQGRRSSLLWDVL